MKKITGAKLCFCQYLTSSSFEKIQFCEAENEMKPDAQFTGNVAIIIKYVTDCQKLGGM